MRRVIRDPVHNLIPLDGEEGELLLTLIDTPQFQRLRRIRQLGVACLTYPGAEHSRWIHSLGVCHVARRMVDTLRRHHGENSAEYGQLKPLRKEILVAALLHDVGHGPFSHIFERAVPSPREAPPNYPQNHEEWSMQIIRDHLAETLQRLDVKTDVVIGLINKKNRDHLLAKDFISSQLDADRMDYLLRDSKSSGPRYGEFDLEWLLHAMRIGKVKIKGQDGEVWRLCFDSHKAIHAVEEFIQAREFMYQQVYVHKTTRAYEALLMSIFRLASNICDGNTDHAPQPCPPALAKMLARQPVDSAEYLELDDFCLWTTFSEWTKLDQSSTQLLFMLARKCTQLVNRQQPYKCIELDNREKQDNALKLEISLQGTSLVYSCHRDAFADLAYRNAYYRKSKEQEEEEDRVIFFIDGEKTCPAESLSKVIAAISNIETQINRLYYDSTDSEMIARLKQEEWIR